MSFCGWRIIRSKNSKPAKGNRDLSSHDVSSPQQTSKIGKSDEIGEFCKDLSKSASSVTVIENATSENESNGKSSGEKDCEFIIFELFC